MLDFSFIGEIIGSKHPLQSIARLYVFRLIKGFSQYSPLTEYLEKHEDEAFQLGFYKNENNGLDIPPKRTYNNYLTKINRKGLHLISEKILSLSTQYRILLDLEISKKAVREKKKTHDKENREAVRLIKKLVYPNIDLKIHHNAKFKKKDFLDVLVYIASKGCCANNGARLFKTDEEKEKCPSGDLMLYHFSKFKSREEIQEIFDNILDVVFNFTKRNYNFLQQRKLDVAYDIHKIPYYGKKVNFTRGGKSERGTSQFFEYLTCSIVEKGRRFILDVIPVLPIDDVAKLMDRSLEKVKKKVRIDKVLCDRGFNGSNFIAVLKKHGLKFLMPMARNTSVKRAFDKALHCKARVFEDFKIRNEKVNLVLVDDELGVKRAFICNFDIHPTIAWRLYERYSKRWGIETGYRTLAHDFRAKTTTRNYSIRLFYFLFSCCLFNLWTLVNICVGLMVYGRVVEKPIISAKLFAILLYKVQLEYWDDGG